MVKLHVRATAQADLEEINQYSALHFGSTVADLYLCGLAEAFAQIADFPQSAPARPDYGKRIRSKIYRSHRILYVFDGVEIVEIYRVIHVSREVRAALKL